LDSSGRGGQREGRRGEVEKEEKKVPNPGPTSMVVSWVGRNKARANLNGGELDFEDTSSTHKGNDRRRGAPSQANLNGGELDKEPFLRDERCQTTVIWA